ncbi:MAG: protein-glutamate O-methyltransferase CheR [Alphaproteobacteria bacterium]|nr:protein-glutamate O-methyltransferase CheR [Alphaproteobacteria bacterium]
MIERDKEFTFGKDDFKKMQDIVYQRTGIVLKDHKMNMVYSRLARRLRALKLQTFKDYLAFLESLEGKEEINNLINAITTNLTKFFREGHHFEHLRDVALKEAYDGYRNGKQNRIRVWSSACSSGEEAYSIAMSLSEAIPNVKNVDAKILATDLDTNMLTTGKNGIYKSNAKENIPSAMFKKYATSQRDGSVYMEQRIKDLISFKQLNLLDEWPFKGPFDAIFCRNVMIYFDNPTKAKLIRKLSDKLKPGGYLYIGHSESILTQNLPFKLEGRTIYRKI